MPYLTETQYTQLINRDIHSEEVIKKLKKAAGMAAAYLIATHNKIPPTITNEELVELLDAAILEKGI